MSIGIYSIRVVMSTGIVTFEGRDPGSLIVSCIAGSPAETEIDVKSFDLVDDANVKPSDMIGTWVLIRHEGSTRPSVFIKTVDPLFPTALLGGVLQINVNCTYSVSLSERFGIATWVCKETGCGNFGPILDRNQVVPYADLLPHGEGSDYLQSFWVSRVYFRDRYDWVIAKNQNPRGYNNLDLSTSTDTEVNITLPSLETSPSVAPIRMNSRYDCRSAAEECDSENDYVFNAMNASRRSNNQKSSDVNGNISQYEFEFTVKFGEMMTKLNVLEKENIAMKNVINKVVELYNAMKVDEERRSELLQKVSSKAERLKVRLTILEQKDVEMKELLGKLSDIL